MPMDFAILTAVGTVISIQLPSVHLDNLLLYFQLFSWLGDRNCHYALLTTVIAVISIQLPSVYLYNLLLYFQLFSWLGDRNRHYIILAAVVAVMSIQGYANLRQQWSIIGEYSNVPLEELVDWITTKTPKG